MLFKAHTDDLSAIIRAVDQSFLRQFLGNAPIKKAIFSDDYVENNFAEQLTTKLENFQSAKLLQKILFIA